MSKAPSMPVFPDALIGDTTDLSIEEFGAYTMLLFVTWRNNGVPLPDDAVRMARICRVSERRWTEKLRPVLSRFFDLSQGTWRQARLEKEWSYVEKHKAIQSDKGKKSAAAKSLKNNNTQSTTVDARLQPDANPQPQPQQESKREDKSSLADRPVSSVTQMPVPPDDAEFREFYASYPLKKDPGRAAKAFRAARKTASHAEIMTGVAAYAQERNGQDPRYTKHPATWLNAKAWLNEPEPAQTLFQGSPYDRSAQPRNGMLAAATAELHRIEAELAANGSFTIQETRQHSAFFDAATTIDGTFQ